MRNATRRSRNLAPFSGAVLPSRMVINGEIPGAVVRVCPRRIKIRVFLDAREKTVNVDPDNLISPWDLGATGGLT